MQGEEGRIAKGGMQLTRQQLKSTYRNKKGPCQPKDYGHRIEDVADGCKQVVTNSEGTARDGTVQANVDNLSVHDDNFTKKIALPHE
jgi:hypothetical protein